jgi:peroxiredoxin
MSLTTRSSLGLACALLFCSGATAQQNPNGKLPITTAPQPYLFLIRDPIVLNDLRVDAKQRNAIQALNNELDPILWSMRNKGTEHTEKAMGKATETAKSRLPSILNRDQQQRLGQVELWTIGTKAFLGDDLPTRLQLTEAQRQRIRDRVTETQQAVAELNKEVQNGGDAKSASKKASELGADLQREILGKLSERQKQKWIELLGRQIDLSALGRVTFAAPDLTDEPDWINSSPLTSDWLRGKVVALHFYAFGCINCKRNFPWYKDWHESFKARGLVVLGIQTPETERERIVENVRNAARENGLEYPIVQDAEKRNWNAWGNSMWPSTYLIDKQGRVRYWWYGELDWQGAGGQNVLRTRIEELLAESGKAE